MGRKKIPIVKIKKESNRLVTFNKRRKGLLKKGLELSIYSETCVGLIVIHPVKSKPKCHDDRKIKMTLFQSHSRLEDVFIQYLRYEIQKDKDEKMKASDDRDKSRIVIDDKEDLIQRLERIKMQDENYKPPPSLEEPSLENEEGSSSSVIPSEHSMPSQPDWHMRNLLMHTHDHLEFLNLVMGLCNLYKDTSNKDSFLWKICQVRLKNYLREVGLQKQMLVAQIQQTWKSEPFDSLNLQHQLQQLQQHQQDQQQHQLHQQQHQLPQLRQQQQHQQLPQHFFAQEEAFHRVRKVEEVIMNGNPSSSTHMRSSQHNQRSDVTGHNGILKTNFYTGAGYRRHHQDLIQPPSASNRGEASTSQMFPASTGFNPTANITGPNSYIHQQSFGGYGDDTKSFCNNGPY